ncbi:MAG TPA: ABC transporter permease [Gemmatimonadales bacterium]
MSHVGASLRAFLARFTATARALRGDHAADQELQAELEAHLELHIEDNVRRGMSPDAARRDALLAARGLLQAREAVRDRRGLPVVEAVVSDVRHALRALLARPGFTAAVVLTLALGIGATTAVFTLVNAVVLRPLPFPDADRILSLSTSHEGQDARVVGERDYFAWQDDARSVTLAASSGFDGAFQTPGGVQEIRGMRVTPAYFTVFGVQPMIGRTFPSDAGEPGGPSVIVLSEQLWRDTFGSDTALVGRTVVVDGRPATVVGVMPARFTTARRAQFWQPLHIEPSTDGAMFWYQTVARLRPGYTLDAARAELAMITARSMAARPADDHGVTPVVMTLHERRYGDRRTPLLLLFAAVGVLLLIACANLASVSLARAAGRRRELAMRRALGAPRWRLVSAMLCESIVLALAGAALGVLLAKGAVAYVVWLSPASVGNMEGIRVDGVVLLFTLGIALLVGLVFGLAPAAAAARGDVRDALSAGGPRSTGGVPQLTARRALVVLQLATALVLLTGAGLVARSFWHATAIDPGFRAQGLLSATVRLPYDRYQGEAARQFFGALLERVRALPGVETATLVDAPPLSGVRMSVSFTDSAGTQFPRIDVVSVDENYFRTIGATMRAGRGIEERDRIGAEPVVVVNRTLARRLAPDGAAVGRTLPFAERPATIVGVVDDVLQRDLETTPGPVAYLPLAQDGVGTYMHVLVRVRGDAAPIEVSVTSAMQSLDRSLAAPTYKAMTAVVAEAVAPRRFTFVLLGSFAAIAATLAIIGLYGVLAYLVADRTREIGIRRALGADARRVLLLVLGQGMVLALVGTLLGLGASVVAVRAVRTLVFGVSVYDPWSFAAVALLLIAVAAIASWLPARRASRVDPVIALRSE